MFQLHYQNRIYSQTRDFQNPEGNMPDFVQAAFSFCKAWLSDQELFTQETSGSTGIPKRITIHRSQMEASAKATGEFFKINSNWNLLCCLNPEYIAGKMMLVRAMTWQCKIELTEPSSNPFFETDFLIPHDFVAMVPLQVEAALSNPKTSEKLKASKNIIIGGAPISSSLQNQLISLGISAYQTFGMTETVSHIALAKISNEELIYKTLPGVTIGITDQQLLWIKSDMSGPIPIQTTDQVDLLSEKSFKWLGRVDYVINSGGIKLHPEVLEQKAAAAVHQFFPSASFFFGDYPDDQLGQKLILFIETRSPEEKKASNLKEMLRMNLSRFEVPKEIVFLKSFHRTPTGKLDRLKTIQNL
jgi:O-succinylbenzoic acid--CoA ligase